MDEKIKKAFMALKGANTKLTSYYEDRGDCNEIAQILEKLRFVMLRADKKYDKAK